MNVKEGSSAAFHEQQFLRTKHRRGAPRLWMGASTGKASSLKNAWTRKKGAGPIGAIQIKKHQATARLWMWVSTGKASSSKAWMRMTDAVLCPTPGSASSSYKRSNTMQVQVSDIRIKSIKI